MRDEHPPRGAGDRIEVDRRFVRQECERERRLRGMPAGHTRGVREVLAHQYLVGLAQ